MHALSMIHFPGYSIFHTHTEALLLSSFPEIFDTKVEPTVDPTGPSIKPIAKNPIQFANRPPPSTFQVLMSEKRALPWLNSPPDGFLKRDQRTKSETMYMIRHGICGTKDVPKISFEVVGSTGNIYRTIIDEVPTCDCPDVKFRKVQCKHICFVLSAMDVPVELRYQKSFLPSELRKMLATLSSKRKLDTTSLASTRDRKPVEGECPICFSDFKPNQKTTWCKDCGSNFHQACFEKWRAAMQASNDVVRCLYCKVPWKGDEHETPRPTGKAVGTEERRSKLKYPNVGDN
ncbi:hypothetical protein N7516_005921 [Penicillium verrucosum]|uniref:uncharacterized protein n=1 Tax=Penicillium verrucosum TaxID=60171 RepID=UPI002545401D|nr:uncharacterized protein N7516_005921 [Penicillium verrucosum]KAJ5931432.1 hypothetical protein N7516_005921 [Penicillium verrucosum]